MSGTKRYSNGWQGRLSYAYSRGRGNTPDGQAVIQQPSQFLGELRLDNEVGPTNVDRPHIVNVSGTYDVPRTGGLKVSAVYSARSGTPYSLVDTALDGDQNGLTTNEYLPAGTYSGAGDGAFSVDYKGGRNGARGHNYQRLDLRIGYRFRLGERAHLRCVPGSVQCDQRAELREPDCGECLERSPDSGDVPADDSDDR